MPNPKGCMIDGDRQDEDEVPFGPPIDSESWCRTRTSEDVKHVFVWTIERFSERPEQNKHFLWSSKFSIRDSEDQLTHWKLKLYPRGDTNEVTDFLSVYLSNQTEFPVKARYEFTILDSEKRKQNKVKSQYTEFRAKPDSWGFRKFLHMDTLKNRGTLWLPDDTLTIVCDISIVGQERVLSGSKYPDETARELVKHKNKGHKQLSMDYEKVFDSDTFSDCKIICDEQEFKCHMFVLAARSPVFQAMFTNDHKEAITKTVHIKNLSSNVVKDMLFYIYTGNTSNLAQGASELLGAADQYQLDLLKCLCEEKLCSTTSLDNAVEHLVLGDMYRAPMLKKMAMSFVVKNMVSVVRTQGWKQKLIQHPELMAEVMESIAERNSGEGPSNSKRQKMSS